MTGVAMLTAALVLMWGVYLIGSGGDRLVEALFLRDRPRAHRGSRLVAWGVGVLLLLGLVLNGVRPPS